MQKTISEFISGTNGIKRSHESLFGRNTPTTSKSKRNQHQDTKRSDDGVVCPVCLSTLWDDCSLINLHIDVCLSKVSSKERNKGNSVLDAGNVSDSLPADLMVEKLDNLPGIWLINNFITAEEEANLLQALDGDVQTPWKHSSFNGHCMQKVFGVRTQFGLPNETRLVRQNDPEKGEYDVPLYMAFLIERYGRLISGFPDEFSANLGEFQQFRVNECNVNSYEKAKKHYLKFHYDDRFLSGPILMNLSLSGRVMMTYYHPEDAQQKHKVILPPRCLQLISSTARWEYLHGIENEDLLDARRVSITFRQSGGKFGVHALPTKKHTIANNLRIIDSSLTNKRKENIVDSEQNSCNNQLQHNLRAVPPHISTVTASQSATPVEISNPQKCSKTIITLIDLIELSE